MPTTKEKLDDVGQKVEQGRKRLAEVKAAIKQRIEHRKETKRNQQ